jgi:hypothetical protein
MQLLTPKPPDVLAIALARVMDPGDTVVLPHAEAAALATAAASLGQRVRLEASTSSHSTVECLQRGRTAPVPAYRPWLSERALRALATGALALLLSLLVSGCGGGGSHEAEPADPTPDGAKAAPRVNCVAYPEHCT